MEAILMRPSSSEQSQIRTPKKNTRHFISRPSENYNIAPSLSSFPKSAQPPLLPLPITKPYASLPPRTRDFSCSPTSRKFNGCPKKPKPSTTPKKQDLKSNSTEVKTESLVIASTNRLGPDPKDVPKVVASRVFSSSSGNGSVSIAGVILGDLEKFSGSVFTLAPPPSSLPLPNFSLRPKLSCKVQASSGIDTGATDNLRRLLRLG